MMKNNKNENKEIKKQMNNRTLLLVSICSAIFTILVIAISMIYYSNQISNSAQLLSGASTEKYDKHFVLISSDPKAAFWQSIYESAKEIAMENNVYLELLGTNLTVEYNQEELLKMAIESKVDGIIVESYESRNMTSLINKAIDSGIPVITVLGDDQESNRQSYVGISNYTIGREFGGQVCKLLEQKEAELNEYITIEKDNETYRTQNGQRKDTYNVYVLIDEGEIYANQNIIFAAIQETIDRGYQGESNVKLDSVKINTGSSFAAEESVRDFFLNTPETEAEPDVIICLNQINTTCVYQAVVDYNLVGQVGILGYYQSDTIINAIDRNVIYSSVSVDTNQMGRYVMQALIEYIQTGYVSEYLAVDTYIIDDTNIENFIEKGDESGDKEISEPNNSN